MSKRDPTALTIDDWIADLERSEADIAAGRTVLLQPVLERLRASIGRMEAREAARRMQQARKA